MNTLQLQTKHSEAFQALPEPYRNDNCLEFFVWEKTLYAKPAKGQVEVLGNWVCYFDKDLGDWIDAKTGKAVSQ
jgi:hypothetical protein